ncbi:MAG: hypothetical protein WBW33_37490 [Bryobacteraceae bacterium]
MSWSLICLAVAQAITVDPMTHADITVRVISAKTGRPMAGAPVRLSVNSRGRNAGIWAFDERASTATDGTAVFRVAPLPERGSIFVTEIAADYCSPPIYELDRVIGTGVAEFRGCPHRSIKGFALPPKPGKIVMYIGEYSRLERALYFPWAN